VSLRTRPRRRPRCEHILASKSKQAIQNVKESFPDQSVLDDPVSGGVGSIATSGGKALNRYYMPTQAVTNSRSRRRRRRRRTLGGGKKNTGSRTGVLWDISTCISSKLACSTC
jgi:hypothetical protein